MSVILTAQPPIVNPQKDIHTSADGNHPKQPRPTYEVADIFRLYGADFRRVHALTTRQLRVMRAIEVCRSAELGGHVEQCDHCGLKRPVYNSCRDRHCPKCQKLATAEWLADRQAELLPVGYFHNVFTLPHELNPLAAANQRLVYGQLFRSVAATLMAFAADPQYGLGGIAGFTSVLHTWDQQLQYHVHLHCIIAGGALAPDGSRWLAARPDQLFSVPALSRAYRAHFLAGLRRARRRNELVLPDWLAEAGGFEALLAVLEAKDWVCFSRAPFANNERVLEYLSRYTHRVAIHNSRLLDIVGGQVTFGYKDRKDGNRRKEATVSATDFISRFLQHVTPKGFWRLRHYGLLSNRHKAQRLNRCRELLGQAAPVEEERPRESVALLLHLTGVDLLRCPLCGEGRMEVVEELMRRPRPQARKGPVVVRVMPMGADTS